MQIYLNGLGNILEKLLKLVYKVSHYFTTNVEILNVKSEMVTYMYNIH